MGILQKKGRRHKLSKHNLKSCKKMKKTKETRDKAKSAYIKNVGTNDVLSGRGAGVSNHPGNIFYRNLVKNYKLEYSQSTLQRKKEIIRFIIDTIQQSSPPGHFLSQNPNTKEWEAVPDDKVQKKTGQALREDAPKIQKMNIISQHYGSQAYAKMTYHVNDVEILLDQINSREAVASFPRKNQSLPTQPVDPSVAVPSIHSSTPTPTTHPHALSHSPNSWCCSYQPLFPAHTPSYQGICNSRNTPHRHQSSDGSPPYHSSQRNLSSSMLEHGHIKREGSASPVWSSAIQDYHPGFKPSYRDGQHPPLHESAKPSLGQKQSHPSGDDKSHQEFHDAVAEEEASNIEPIPFEVTVFTPERKQKTTTEKSYPELDDLDHFFFEARIDEALGPFREEEAVESSHGHSTSPQISSEFNPKLFQPKRGHGNS